ncbi:MAG: hypothetical protein IPJ24_16350 [bacterium]|nr:hypothetical protein [bacterium]
MRYLRCLFVLLPAAALLAGCGEGFPDEEMHLGLDAKVRPYAVVIEPPEAAPGDTVQVTLYARAPRPDDLDITWRVALDFDRGLYEVDEVERNLRALAVPPPVFDADGFLTQTFRWVVPDSTLLYSSAIPEVPDDPALPAIVALLPGLDTSAPLRKDEIDAWLKAHDIYDVLAMDLPTVNATWALADRFACAVRLRATLRTDVVVDVTRNLTIRYTRQMGGPNGNVNTYVPRFEVVAVEKRDAAAVDIYAEGVAHTIYRFIDDGERLADRVDVPLHDDWTYFFRSAFVTQNYSSPWDPAFFSSEAGNYDWYYYRQDAPTSEHAFFVTDDGDAAEMWNLDEHVRVVPDGPGSTFRVVCVVRDSRIEWVSFHATPGTALVEGIVSFQAP